MVGDADADDGADESVRAGGGKPEPPSAEVPDDGGDQKGEDHGESGFAADLEDQFDGQQGHDAEGDGAAGDQHAEEIPHSGPDYGDVRLEGVSVDDGGDGVGGVVEAVDEFKSQGGEQRDAQQDERQCAGGMDVGEVAQQMRAGIDQADDQSYAEDSHANFGRGAYGHFGI